MFETFHHILFSIHKFHKIHFLKDLKINSIERVINLISDIDTVMFAPGGRFADMNYFFLF